MIGNKVANPDKSASKAVRIERLAAYIRAPETENAAEKCIYAGARGFLTDTPRAQTAEMVALAEDAVRSRDPINHYVLSWREGEQPSPEQVEEAVDLLLKEMVLDDHQAIYGLHADTENYHLHVIVNRVHPDTGRVKKVNRGFDVESLHRAVVRTEHTQGWTVEENKRYQMVGGRLERTDPDAGSKPRRPSQQQLDRERRSGEKSAARVAIETAAPLIAAAGTWDELHASLAEQGMRYAQATRARTGATVTIGDVTIRASRVSREATLRSLEARLGSYRPADPSLERGAEPRDAAPLIADARSWRDLHATLAERGMRYMRVGSGARIVASGLEAKASAIAREASLGRLERRLGPYQAAEAQGPAPEPAAQPQHPDTDPKTVATLIANAESWSDLHASLAERAMRYERVGSGAHIVIGDTRVKASTVAREASLGTLQKRFGSYEPAADGLPERKREPVAPENPQLREYLAAREAFHVEKEAHWLFCRTEYEEEIEALRDKQARERADLFDDRDWHGLGLVLNAMRSVLAHEHAKAKAELREKRRRAREEHRLRYPAWPPFEQWLLDQNAPDLAHQWRYRAQPIGGFEGEGASRAVARDIRGYEAQVDGDRVLYRRRGTSRSRVAFADVGRRINVYDWRSEESTLAALQLSAEKWGKFVVTGNDEFKAMCVRLAALHDFRITNPELQERIADERARVQAEQETAERAQAERLAATREELVIPDVARANGPEGERRTSQPPAPPAPTERRAEETSDLTPYGADAVRLFEEFERLRREHGALRLGIDLGARHGSSVGIAFVDAWGNRCYSGRESVATIAAMRTLMEKRPPDEIPEIKRTLKREIAVELARTRARVR